MRIHVSASEHASKLHNTCTHLHKNPKSRSSRTSIVYTFSIIQSAAASLFVFISTQTNVYTHRENIQLSSTSPALTTDSDINDVSMYYCTLLLLPWVLCEICILSSLFHVPSWSVSYPFIKKKMFWFCVTQGSRHYEMLSDRCKSHDFRSLEMCT
jgi:hypothetical protein